MTILKKIKEYKYVQNLKLDCIKKQKQLETLKNRSLKASRAIDANGVNFRIEDRIKFYDLKMQELKSKSLALRIVTLFI